MTGQVTTGRGAGNRVSSLWSLNYRGNYDDTLAILCDECATALANRLGLKDGYALGLGKGWFSRELMMDKIATYGNPYKVHTPACDFQGGEL